MRRLGGISLVGVAVAAAAVGLSAHATAATGPASTSTRDVAYSCGVQKAKAVYFYAGVKLPASYYTPNPYTDGKASPGELGFATGGQKTAPGGTGAITLTKLQANVVAKKNAVAIDGKKCTKLKTKLKKKIGFSTKGLPIPVTATRHSRGYAYKVCDTAVTKVVFRLQVHYSGGTPTSAVFAVQNANPKGKPIALIYWNPKKVRAHFENACNDLQ